jgi:hypothetical protein
VESDQWFNRITNRIQEYWEEYNGYVHCTRRLEESREKEETSGLSGVTGLFLLSLVQTFSALLNKIRGFSDYDIGGRSIFVSCWAEFQPFYKSLR